MGKYNETGTAYEFVPLTVLALPCSTFAYRKTPHRRIANDLNLAQTGKIIAFKFRKCLYVVQFASQKESAQAARNF